MRTVAIICEYNPFHSGHEYQINEIRREFGSDTCIIALMSGNFTQRGEIAMADKLVRARAAVDSGVNLCLELPFPFSMSCAELFALSAVRILNSLRSVDYLSFGSECGDIGLLEYTADALMSEEYESNLAELIGNKNEDASGYPKLCEMALKKVIGEGKEYAMLTPNNILALEYIKALRITKSSISAHTIKRRGADYNDDTFTHPEHKSATAIRSALCFGDKTALEYMPNSSSFAISDAIERGEAPCDESALSSAVISFFRLNPTPTNESIHDVGGGLYNRLKAKSFEANTIKNLVQLTETKKYTSARIRRAIWYSFFGVTSSEIKESPAYTSLLATDGIGRLELKKIKKSTDFPVITKPSAIADLDDVALRQKMTSDKADSIFQLTKPSAPNGNFSLTASPYVKDRD